MPRGPRLTITLRRSLQQYTCMHWPYALPPKLPPSLRSITAFALTFTRRLDSSITAGWLPLLYALFPARPPLTKEDYRCIRKAKTMPQLLEAELLLHELGNRLRRGGRGDIILGCVSAQALALLYTALSVTPLSAIHTCRWMFDVPCGDED